MVIGFAFVFKSKSKIAHPSERENKGSTYYVHQLLVKLIKYKLKN